MDIAWGGALLAAKWLFIGLIYLALFVVLVAVRQEMRQRLRSGAPLRAGGPGRLRILDAGSDARLNSGDTFALENDVSLGAEPQNDIVLDDRYISGRHARLRWDGVNWWLEDLGSKNGTFVQERRCPPYVEQLVPAGVPIRLGGMKFELAE